MEKRNDKFESGDILTDVQYKEVFAYDDDRDGRVTKEFPERFRLANENEIKFFKEKGHPIVDLDI